MHRHFPLFFLVLLILCGPVCAWGQNADFSKLYKPGATLYVHCPDGLVLNDKPGVGSNKVKTVLYGSQVLIQKDHLEQMATISNNIPGHWVWVKSDSAIGFMFDGYLSRWLPVGDREPGKSYLDKISRMKTTDKKSPISTIRDYERIIYENGVIYESKIFDTGSTTSITIPQNIITLQEAYLLSLSIFPNYKNTICQYNPVGIRCSDGSERTLKVKREGNSFVIKEEVKE